MGGRPHSFCANFFQQNLLRSPRSPPHKFQNKTQSKTEINIMTLLKCISTAALLSGVATTKADSADNVSSRLQVHVRDNNLTPSVCVDENA